MKITNKFGNKLWISSLMPALASIKFADTYFKNEMVQHQCAEPTKAVEDEAKALEKIFAEGGAMMDQQEMMELMMNRGKDAL